MRKAWVQAHSLQTAHPKTQLQCPAVHLSLLLVLPLSLSELLHCRGRWPEEPREGCGQVSRVFPASEAWNHELWRQRVDADQS